MITPTVGRIVLYQAEPGNSDQAAIVTCVHSDCRVNLTVFTADGYPCPAVSVPLRQAEDEPVAFGPSCHWMDYQVEQAAKAEEAEVVMASEVAATEAKTARRRTG